MPKLFDGFCYPGAADAFAAFRSQSVVGNYGLDASLAGDVVSYTLSATVDSTPHTITGSFTLADCSAIGPLHNESGLSVEDVVLVSWSVVAVFAAAWSFKVLRRAL